jgi:hypothetical protein
MKKVMTSAALVALLSAASALAQEKPAAARPMPKSVNAERLMANETKLLEAVRTKDAKTFASMVMSGSWSVDTTGLQANDDFVKLMSDPKADLKIEMLKASEMKVIDVDANTAIVVYKVDQKGSMMGMALPPSSWASTVWSNMGGTWKAVFHQETTAAPPPR